MPICFEDGNLLPTGDPWEDMLTQLQLPRVDMSLPACDRAAQALRLWPHWPLSIIAERIDVACGTIERLPDVARNARIM